MGVAMLPRFAAMVSRTTAGISQFFRVLSGILSKQFSVRGTSVIRLTSFVINMLRKNAARTRTVTVPAIPLLPATRRPAMTENTPRLRTPAMTVIRQKRRPRVRKSM